MTTLKSWVAFDKDDFPFGFASADHCTLTQAAKEWPTAVRIELCEGERRSNLLQIHAGG